MWHLGGEITIVFDNDLRGVLPFLSLHHTPVRTPPPPRSLRLPLLLAPACLLYDCWWCVDTDGQIVEAVFENMGLKKRIFKQLDSVCKPSAILCTNTSTLDIDQIARATNR